MRQGPHSMLPRDTEGLDDAALDRSTVRRVWGFARPYRGKIAGFLAAIVGAALLGLAPPLIFGAIIDDAIAEGDRGHLTVLALLAIGAAAGRERARPRRALVVVAASAKA